MRIYVLSAAFLLVSVANAQSSQCPSGFQPYNSRCITQAMADYISCIEASGGNKQELNDEIGSASEKQKSGGAAIEAGTKAIKAGGSLVLGANTESKIVQKFEAKWFPAGMSECARVLENQRRSGTISKSAAQPQHPKLPIRVTVKAARFEFFPGFEVTPSYFSGPKGEDVELDSPAFGKLHLIPGDEPTTVSVGGKHYTLRAERITTAGITLVLDVVRH